MRPMLTVMRPESVPAWCDHCSGTHPCPVSWEHLIEAEHIQQERPVKVYSNSIQIAEFMGRLWQSG